MENKTVQFEQAFGRLEEILQSMNTSELSLDASLACYEEADKLITDCQKMLKSAEKKVETLMKKRNQDLELDELGQPQVEEFNTQLN